MYNFIDVNEQQSASLSSEAMSVNGSYIENDLNEITGVEYKTLYTSGREMLETELFTEDTEGRNGSVYKGRKYRGRTLRVGYQLKAATNEVFIMAYDKLSFLLDHDELKIIFADESYRYYLGTKTGITEPEPGSNNVTGEIEIFCSDPYKYSVDEYTANAVVGEDGLPIFTIDYDGTALSRPSLEAVLTAESGFIGFADNEENMIQLGDYDEQDGVTREKDVLYLNTPTSPAWSTWTDNAAVLMSGIQTGTPSKGAALTVSNYGSGTSWHGPSVTADVSANSITNGKCSFKYRFQTPNSKTGKKQAGLMTFIAMGGTSSAKTRICEVRLEIKNGSHTGYAYIYVAGIKVGTLKFASNKANAFTNGTIIIEKFGGKINVSVGGKTYSYNNTSLLTATINYVGCYVAKYKAVATPSSYVTVYSVSVLKHNVEWWDEVENKFQPGNIVEVDCANAKIRVDGILTNKLGTLGNDWENFGLRSGTNVIVCDASSWVTEMPTFSMKYRKVWI